MKNFGRSPSRIFAILLCLFLPLSFDASYGVGQDPRAKLGHPSNVTNLHVVKLDPGHSFIELAWNLNRKSEGVDEYAIYFPGRGQPPFSKVWKIVKTNHVYLKFVNSNSLTYGDAYPINPPLELSIWIIAHNRFGWGINNFESANPDQNYAAFCRSYLKHHGNNISTSFFDLNYITVSLK